MAGNFGNKLKVQFGKESTYGTIGTATNQIATSSEGFKIDLSKKDEGLLTGGKLSGRNYIMGRRVEGSINALCRPDDGLLIGCALGKETTAKVDLSTGVYEHTFTIGDPLPSLSFMIDRVEAIKAYTGMKVDSLSFDASSGDFCKLDVNLKGKEETTGTILSTLSNSPLAPFRFKDAVIKVGGVPLDAKSVKFELTSSLDNDTQTTNTGIYYKEPDASTREIKIDADVLYDTTSNTIRDSYFLQDQLVEVEIIFESDIEIEEGFNYGLKFTIPNAEVLEAHPTVSGADRITYGLSMRAVEVGATEPLTVVLTNSRETNYI